MGFGAGVYSQEQVTFGGTSGGLCKSLGETQFLLKAAPLVTQRPAGCPVSQTPRSKHTSDLFCELGRFFTANNRIPSGVFKQKRKLLKGWWAHRGVFAGLGEKS